MTLSNTDEVLLRAAIVKTFSQIPGVAKVMITVGSGAAEGCGGTAGAGDGCIILY